MMCNERCEMLDREKPLAAETKPIAGLKGILWNEMVEIHN